MNNQNKYGEKVQYTQGESLMFPDFKVSFVGERKVEVPQHVNGFFQYYDFEVFSNSETITISWSSGTGDIAPTIFKFQGKDFLLEKGTSDILGNLKENEIVIWNKDKSPISRNVK